MAFVFKLYSSKKTRPLFSYDSGRDLFLGLTRGPKGESSKTLFLLVVVFLSILRSDGSRISTGMSILDE